ncbi:MAG: helix-turn-helix transcriptional regulator [Clostridiales bacterium]|nr:helix-turn-helix transcriptional regulator [Clostridiales bacterium]
MSTIGDNIKELRKYRKLTQKQLAEMINKKEITIRRYESGDIEPPVSVLEIISEKLNVPFDYFFSKSLSKIDIELLDKNIDTKKLSEEVKILDYLGKAKTEQLIEELNNRSDFPVKIEIK